ncbi:hypothetical protein [Bizionia sp.]|uniref:hypothetical protein n=1 Tax=Bizionia sp. TaxID=1954480 RepID=UPI003A94911C
MKYFGKLERKKFEKESQNKQDEILVLNEFYERIMRTGNVSVSDAFSKSVRVSLTPSNQPTKILVDEIYELLLVRYKLYIENIFIAFFHEFNEEIYGLTHAEARKIALQNFKLIYKDLKIEGFNKVNRETSSLGIENIAVEKRLEYLSLRRMAIKRNIAIRSFVLEYLYGNMEFFTDEFVNENDLINEFIFFESQLKIILSLNDRYAFETDIYFSKAAKAKNIFEKYPNIFTTLESFLKIHLTIENLEENVSSSINCLYHAINELKLIKGKKSDFITYLKDEHAISKTNIPKIETEFDSPDVKRIHTFLKEFKEFASENP